jgi:hypothetical protein
MVGEAGPTDNDERVGFTKNPVQLAAKAKDASTANAPSKRKFVLFDDISSLASSRCAR